jgi:hypothetical protein
MIGALARTPLVLAALFAQGPTGGAAPDAGATTTPPAPPADGDKPAGIWEPPHYDEEFVLVSSPKSAPLPYRLKLSVDFAYPA